MAILEITEKLHYIFDGLTRETRDILDRMLSIRQQQHRAMGARKIVGRHDVDEIADIGGALGASPCEGMR
jgi:hypothetical protein